MGPFLLGEAVYRKESLSCFTIYLTKIPLALTAPFSATSDCEPAPKPEIPWTVYFPFVYMLTTNAEEPLGEAHT